jgi:NAD(P)-dependent dehydrogenase (short-subunit alcohol dehydrogenase family)
MRIKDKIAIVTGAASGIGNAVCHHLAEAGAKAIAMVDLTDGVQDAAQNLNSAAGSDLGMPFQGDVTDGDFRKRVFAEIGRAGMVQICVPAAGILRDAMSVKVNKENGKAELYDEHLFRQVLEVNLMHPIYWSMQLMAGIAEFRASNGFGKWSSEEEIQGAAVLIGSVSCRGNRGQVSYSSAKAGLNAAAKTLNIEGAYHGMQAKIVHPGFVETPMVEQLPDGMFEQHLKQLVPIDRMIKPEEIASTIAAMIENPIISGPVWADGGLPPMA